MRQSDEWKGQSLAGIELVDPDGMPVRWEQFDGKVLVVETWFFGCTYCKHAFPYYEKLRRQLQPENVVFMALNTGDEKTDGPAQIREWLGKAGKEYGFVWVRARESGQGLMEKLTNDGAPTFFVVGADGKIAASYSGFGYGNGGEDPRLREALKKAGVSL